MSATHVVDALCNEGILKEVFVYAERQEDISVIARASLNQLTSVSSNLKEFVVVCASVGSADAVTIFRTSYQQLLDGAIKSGQMGVASTFFNNQQSEFVVDGQDLSSLRNELAVNAICYSLTHVASHDFEKTVNRTTAQSNIQQWIRDSNKAPHVASLYFTQHVKEQSQWHSLSTDSSLPHLLGIVLVAPPYLRTLPELMRNNPSLGGVMLEVLGMLDKDTKGKVQSVWQADPAIKTVLTPFNINDFIPNLENHYLHEQPFLTEVKNAVNNTRTWESSEPVTRTVYSPMGPRFVTEHVAYMNYEYGKAVANWLPTTASYGLRTRTNPHTYDKAPKPSGGGGCFIAGTKVLLATGSSVDIARVKEGQEVLTRNGQVGIISAERVVSLHEAGDIYGINDDAPFFTGPHVFYTPTGLKALHPHGARKENPWLEVNQLSEGDYVYHAHHVATDKSGKHTVNYNLVQIKKFTRATQLNVPVFGLHFHEGLRSYHANGYLVHLNYPELTTQSLASGYNNLAKIEKDELHKTLLASMPELRKTFGPSVAAAIESIVEQHPEAVTGSTHPEKPRQQASISHLHHRKYYFVSDFGDKLPRELVVCKQHVHIDGEHVRRVHFNKHELHWTRKTTSGNYEHCFVHFDGPHFLHGSGSIVVTKNKHETVPTNQDAHKLMPFHLVTSPPAPQHTVRALATLAPTVVSHAVARENRLLGAATVAASKYSTFIATKAMAESDIPLDPDSGNTPDGYQPFWDFLYGSTVEEKEAVSFLYFKVQDTLRHFGKRYIFTGSTNLRIVVPIDPNLQGQVGYSRIDLTFSVDSLNFTGIIWAHDAKAVGFLGKRYSVYGTYTDEEKVAAENAVHNLIMSNAYNVRPNTVGVLRAPAGRFARVAERPSPAPVTTFLAAATATALNVNNLLKLLGTFPTNTQVKDSSFRNMHQMMLAAVPDDWLTNVFGESRPTLDNELNLQLQQEDVKRFLKEKYGIGYAAKALAGIPEASGAATAKDWRKLDYYFTGKDTDNVMSKDPVYNRLNKVLAMHAYTEYAQGLNDYITDAKGTNKWSDLVYKSITSPPYLTRLTSQMSDPLSAADGYQTLNNLVMLLRIISTSDSQAPLNFYNKVMNRLTSDTNQYTEADMDTQTLTDYLRQIIVLMFSSDPNGMDPAIKAKYSEDIRKMAEELQIQVTNDAEAMANSILTRQNIMIAEMAALFNARFDGAGKALGSFAEKAANVADEIAKKYPRLIATTKVLTGLSTLGFYAFSLFQTAAALKGWDDIKEPGKKAQLIVNTINMSAQILLKAAPEFLDSLVTAWRTFRNPNATPSEVSNAIQITEQQPLLEAEGLTQEASAIPETIKGSTVIEESAAKEETIFARFAASKAPRLLLKGLNIVAIGVSMWALGEQIMDDFKNGASTTQKALDITSMVVLGLQAVIEIVDFALIALDVVCPMIPVVGAILAIAGLILQLVAMILNKPSERKPPPSEQQKFFTATVLPYFTTLAEPPKDFYSDDFTPQLSRYYQIKRTNVDGDFKSTYKYLQLTATSGDVRLTTADTYVSMDDRNKQLWKFIAGTAAQGKEVPFTLSSLTEPYTLSDSGIASSNPVAYYLKNAGKGLYFIVNTSTNKALTYHSDGTVSFTDYSFDNADQRWGFDIMADGLFPSANQWYFMQSRYASGQVMAASGNKPQVVADSEPAKTATEHWKFVYKSVATKTTGTFSFYQIVNMSTNQAVAYTSLGDGQSLSLVAPSDDSKQQWGIKAAYSGAVYLIPKDNDTKAIKVPSDGSTNLILSGIDISINSQEWIPNLLTA